MFGPVKERDSYFGACCAKGCLGKWREGWAAAFGMMFIPLDYGPRHFACMAPACGATIEKSHAMTPQGKNK